MLPQFNVREERVIQLSCPSVKLGSWSSPADGEFVQIKIKHKGAVFPVKMLPNAKFVEIS